MKRRGLLAAGWAAVVALVAKQTTAPVAATTTDTNFVANGNATNFDARGAATYGCDTEYGTFAVGMYGRGSSNGIYGLATSTYGTGVHGAGDWGVLGNSTVVGVQGLVTGGGAATRAVYGVNDSTGSAGTGVRGTIPNTSAAAATIAVYGENFSANTGGSPGAGGFGCYGYSLKGHGLVGATGTAGGGALVGSTNGVPGAYAGIMYGPFVVVGGPKSAAVANGDGSHSLLYCVESPESWFEDFGEAQLECGRAEVSIDPAFAAVADLTNYHVFLTAHSHQHLAVTARSAERFRVEADPNLVRRTATVESDLEGTFSWRLVAKRKDITAPRLAKITLPAEPRRPDPPTAPVAPRTPPRSRGL